MSVCTFFGHRDCPETIRPKLHEALVELIEERGVDSFYVGNHGTFDRMVRSLLRELSERYPHIRYSVVLAYVPQRWDEFDQRDFSDTMVPEGVETVPPRFAIAWRNKWMLREADYVVTYITHGWGGAAQYAEMAERWGKTIIRLAE
ncbi:MAG: hypothetical protein IJE26_04320 [Oscillospiraceae bacterium]|nr:hypothetical protein [Oscillospiraceae bacterium]